MYRHLFAFWTFVAATVLLAGLPSTAESQSMTASGYDVEAVQITCGPRGPASTAFAPVARLVAARENRLMKQFGSHTEVVIDAGSAQGIAVGQEFLVRRAFDLHDDGVEDPLELSGAQTAGWVRVTEVHPQTAVVEPVHLCRELGEGDFLEPFELASVPARLADGDPTAAGTVLFGADGRRTAGEHELVVIDRGLAHGIQAGQALQVVRSEFGAGAPVFIVGDATVVAVMSNAAMVRIDRARDAVARGDLVVAAMP